MVTKQISKPTLSNREHRVLVAMVNELHGIALNYDEFADVMLGLFEDIPGFEAMSPEKANPLLLKLWSSYHG